MKGGFALVLHSHLPWLAHHGAWPVGEEWLYQAWGASYLRVLDVFDTLAAAGHRNIATLGLTPVLAAQLDDEHCVHNFHTWLGFWQSRSEELGASRDPQLRELAKYEFQQASDALLAHDRRGALSDSFRRLATAGVIELLGGPATHPFQPLYPDEVVRAQLRIGQDDAKVRWGETTSGIWAPECGYRPGLEEVYQQVGIDHFLMDGPTFLHVGAQTWAGRPVGDTDVMAYARDLEVSYRVWSPKRGYPSDPWYRDFHTFHHGSGFRPARVTSVHTEPTDKAPYDPVAVQAVIERDAHDFVATVVKKLARIESERGRTGLVVAAYDTELFGHWWHEGPSWLLRVLQLLPEAGVEVTTLSGARMAGYVGERVRPEAGSWGSGKDWRVWAGVAVADLVRDNEALVRRWQQLPQQATLGRDQLRDQASREAILALSSDWAFMVSKDSAAGYARARHNYHHQRFAELAGAIEVRNPQQVSLDQASSAALAKSKERDFLFAHLDARALW